MHIGVESRWGSVWASEGRQAQVIHREDGKEGRTEAGGRELALLLELENLGDRGHLVLGL